MSVIHVISFFEVFLWCLLITSFLTKIYPRVRYYSPRSSVHILAAIILGVITILNILYLAYVLLYNPFK